MGWSDDTAEFNTYGTKAYRWMGPSNRQTIVVQYCAGLSRDELDDEKRYHESRGWKNVQVTENPGGDWRTYTWTGIK